MLDHGNRWPVVPDWETFALSRPDLSVSVRQPSSQAWVSGNLDAFRRAADLPNPDVGALGIAEGEAYAVRVARDRLLAVGVSEVVVEAGWHDEGYAVTATDAGLLVFAFVGRGLGGLIARATILSEEDRSPSAATVFAGLPAVVYRHGDELRVHVERALATALAGWLAELPPKL